VAELDGEVGANVAVDARTDRAVIELTGLSDVLRIES
jgi:hypothetical protein